jgi:hypothetical protein
MASSALAWAAGRSKLPPNLKLTMFALALVADADKGFGNVYLSKSKIGQLTSRSERIAAEDMSDLVLFGVLLVLEVGGGRRRSTLYQVIFERLNSWSDEDTEKLAQIRRLRRERVPKMPKQKPRSVQQGIGRKADDGNPDPYSSETLIRTAKKPRSVQQGIRTTPDLEDEGTVEERGERPEHAVENSAAPLAESRGGSARPLMPFSDNPYHAVKPGETRHLLTAQQHSVYYATSQNPEENRTSTNSAAFHILSEAGRKLLAGYGLEEIPWADVRSDLRNRANRLGIDLAKHADLLQRVEDSLIEQHAHFLAVNRADPAHLS